AWLLGCGARTDLDGSLGRGVGGSAAAGAGNSGSTGAVGGNGGGTCTFLCLAQGCNVVALATGQKDLSSLVTDATHVYWIDGTVQDPGPNASRRAPKSGGPTETLVPAAQGAEKIAVEHGSLYWIEAGHYLTSGIDGAVRRVDVTGGAISTIADGLSVD